MDRQVTPPKRVTLPTWGPPPPCKQALNLLFCLVLVRLLLSSKAVLCDVNDIVAAQGLFGIIWKSTLVSLILFLRVCALLFIFSSLLLLLLLMSFCAEVFHAVTLFWTKIPKYYFFFRFFLFYASEGILFFFVLSRHIFNWPLQKIPQHTIMLFVCHPKILHKHCFQFLLGPF